jgi:hypothetical protein
VLARAAPTSARTPTGGARTTPIAAIARRCDETPLKHGPAESPQNAESSAKLLCS